MAWSRSSKEEKKKNSCALSLFVRNKADTFGRRRTSRSVKYRLTTCHHNRDRPLSHDKLDIHVLESLLSSYAYFIAVAKTISRTRTDGA